MDAGAQETLSGAQAQPAPRHTQKIPRQTLVLAPDKVSALAVSILRMKKTKPGGKK